MSTETKIEAKLDPAMKSIFEQLVRLNHEQSEINEQMRSKLDQIFLISEKPIESPLSCESKDAENIKRHFSLVERMSTIV